MFSLYLWLKFIHVLAGFTFIMAHGTAIALSFRLKHEKDLTRIQAMLDLSGNMWVVMVVSLLLLLVAGVISGFIGDWWSRGWIWVSLVMALGVTIWMFVIGQGTYHPIRKAFGMSYMRGGKEREPEMPLPEAERNALIAKTNPWSMFLIGYGGFMVILWLMIFKPF
jgi:hypothetical protein